VLDLLEFSLGIGAGAAAALAGRALFDRLRARSPPREANSSSPHAASASSDAPGSPAPQGNGISASGTGALLRDTADPGPTSSTRASEKVILHLYRSEGPASEVVRSKSVTQAGMGAALGFTQSALTRTLGRLIAAGVLQVERQHVSGQSRRLKVYRLTPLGAALARNLDRKGREPDMGGQPPSTAPVDSAPRRAEG
jgi:DNA-binding MarR family transcriptional regulator